jgi:hypothetical protein
MPTIIFEVEGLNPGDINEFSFSFVNDQEQIDLLQKAADALKFIPFIYKGLNLESNTILSNHYIKHKVGVMDPNAILFFVPTQYDASNSGQNVQTLRLLQPGEGFSITSPNIKSYTLLIEQTTSNNTTLVQAKAFHLKPNRLYILRYHSPNELVIVNYTENELVQATKFIADEGEFNTVPKVIVNDEPVALVKITELQALIDRVTALENKIKFGTQPVEEVLGEDDAPGTVYIKVENYGGNEN